MLPLTVTSVWEVLGHLASLAIAYVLAFPIGWDREREERSAGLRTFPLVALASCSFVVNPETILDRLETSDAHPA